MLAMTSTAPGSALEGVRFQRPTVVAHPQLRNPPLRVLLFVIILAYNIHTALIPDWVPDIAEEHVAMSLESAHSDRLLAIMQRKTISPITSLLRSSLDSTIYVENQPSPDVVRTTPNTVDAVKHCVDPPQPIKKRRLAP